MQDKTKTGTPVWHPLAERTMEIQYTHKISSYSERF